MLDTVSTQKKEQIRASALFSYMNELALHHLGNLCAEVLFALLNALALVVTNVAGNLEVGGQAVLGRQ